MQRINLHNVELTHAIEQRLFVIIYLLDFLATTQPTNGLNKTYENSSSAKFPINILNFLRIFRFPPSIRSTSEWKSCLYHWPLGTFIDYTPIRCRHSKTFWSVLELYSAVIPTALIGKRSWFMYAHDQRHVSSISSLFYKYMIHRTKKHKLSTIVSYFKALNILT